MKKYLFTDTKTDPNGPLRVDSLRIRWETDTDPDLSYLEQYSAMSSDDTEEARYAEEDRMRLAAYNRGEWEMQGCIAEAVVSYPIGQGSRRLETFTSGGLWGIESDSGDEYRAEVEAEQVADLRDHLARFGITLPEGAEVAAK